MSDAKEPTWPFAVIADGLTFYVQGPNAVVMFVCESRRAALECRDALARAYNFGWDGHAEGQQRAYVP